ncbi:MAG TPA: type ISP restriction/modification enzyme [Pyrinomonadaceae bacterium]|nr:type ISP restriction/modification enzyme [Pyrinomonadaceae bacterium]
MAKIYYHATPVDWRKEQKYKFLDEHGSVSNIEWTEITPDAKGNWLTAGMEKEFDEFISIGNKEAKASSKTESETIFKIFSNGVKTNRDAWAYNFNKKKLANQIQSTIEFFEEHRQRWHRSENLTRVKKLREQKVDLEKIIDDFVANEDSKISWSGTLKSAIVREDAINFDAERIRETLYRPFQKTNLYFDRSLVERVYVFPSIFPNLESERENSVFAFTAIGNTQPFQSVATKSLPDIHFTGDTTCFPFYTYNEDGTNRRENITDWALKQFRTQYEQSRAEQSRAEQSRAEQSRAEQSRAEQSRNPR